MRKIALLFTCLTVVFALSLALGSCDKLITQFPVASTNTGTTQSNTTGNSKDSETPADLEHIITFDSQGGTDVESQIVKDGKKGKIPQKPQKPGYTFEGWYLDGERWSFSQTLVTKDIHLVAKWEPMELSLIFDGNGATEGSTEGMTGFTTDKLTLNLNGFVRDGYTFVGWSSTAGGAAEYTDGGELTLGTDEVTTLYAVWSADPYTIIYNLDGGNNNAENPVGFSVDTLPIKLLKPNKSECIFVGWYTSEDFSGEPVTEITELGNIQVYAKFMSATAGFEYKKYDEYAEIKGYSGQDTVVLIPEYYDGLPVMSIGRAAFLSNETVKSVALTEHIISIGTDAFKDCTTLEEIKGGERISRMLYGAFSGCTALKSMTISERVTEISGDLFSSCSSLESVLVIGQITSVGDYAFKDCTSLKSFEIGDSVSRIGDYAFSGCTLLESISFGNSVEYVGSHSFEKCTSIKEINLVDNITELGSDAFSGCSLLEKVTIGKGITSISSYAFSKCTSLKELTIGENVETIGENAFRDCDSIVSIIVGNKVKEIGRSAFYSCDMLESVELGDSVISLAGYCFKDCSKLSNVVLGQNVEVLGDYTFGGCKMITSIEIPAGVKKLGAWLFAQCTSITSIVIPKATATIGDNVFYGCTSLESINVDAENEAYSSYNGDLYTKSGIGLIAYAIGKKDTSFEAPEGVTSIYSYAFANAPYLESVKIGENIKSIGNHAFDGCKALTSVEFVVTDGWVCSTNPTAQGGTNMDSTILANAEEAANTIKEAYVYHYWKRS